jgi:hypothetical protein
VSAIETLPSKVTRAGLDFNYSLWTAGTTITLVNVPWNNDYRDIVRFDRHEDLDAWIDAEENTSFTNASMQKLNMPVQLPISHVDAQRFNYLRAENGMLPEGFSQSTRNYYYFVLGTEYVNPTTTRFLLQLDVWSTYGYEVTFGSCFVERGHIGIANENGFDHYGRDYLAEPEGFDVGSEYRIVHTESQTIMNVQSDDYSVLVCSIVDMTMSPEGVGTDAVPILVPASGSTFQNMPSGAQFFIFRNGDDFHSWLQAYQQFPWVTQGIISITMIPSITRYYPGFEWDTEVAGQDLPATFYNAPDDYPDWKTTSCLPNWRDHAAFAAILGGRYAALKKFFTFPYMAIELTTWTGSPLLIKPESWQDANARVKEMVALVPPGQRIALIPNRYNADDVTESDAFEPAWVGADDHAEFLDFAAVISGFPTLPIVNDQAIAYLAQNRNALAFAFRSADWSQQRALQTNQVGFEQASQSMNLMGQLTGIGINQANTQAGIEQNRMMTTAAIGAVGSVAGGAAEGAMLGPAGALAGGLAGAVGGAAQIGSAAANASALGQSTAARNTGAQQATAAQQGTAGYMRDTNRGLADWAARGDYANAIAGTQSKIQDAQLLQPSTSGQFGGDAFNLVNNIFGFSIRWKMPSPKHIKAVGDYWLRYGYSVRQFIPMPTSLHVMTRFTYWNLSETYISQGRFPEGFKQIIRGIFEKGVTVWRDPADIGTIDWADNQPIAGITY